jgi:hypothetical protein
MLLNVMQISYIDENAPNLPAGFVCFSADNVRDAFKKAVKIGANPAVELAVWNGSMSMFSADEREAFRVFAKSFDQQTFLHAHLAAKYNFVFTQKGRETKHEKILNAELNALASKSAHQADAIEDIKAPYKRSVAEIFNVASTVGSLKYLASHLKFTQSNVNSLGEDYHTDGLTDGLNLRVIRTLKGTGTIFVPRNDAFQQARGVYSPKPKTSRLWMTKEGAMAFMFAGNNSRGRAVHAAPHASMNPFIINPLEDRLFEVCDMKYYPKNYPIAAKPI